MAPVRAPLLLEALAIESQDIDVSGQLRWQSVFRTVGIQDGRLALIVARFTRCVS